MGKPLSKASTVAFRDGIAESWADNSVEIERGKSLKPTNSRVVILLGLTDKIAQLLEEQKGCESAIYLHGICEIPMKRHGGTVPFSRKLEIRLARREMSFQRYGGRLIGF